MDSLSSGGEIAAKHPNLSSPDAVAGEDRLSALPNDIIVSILLRLDTIAESVRTSVLSTRWRRIWTLLPELTFSAPYDRHILQILSAPEAPALGRFVVATNDNDPAGSMAAWLPIAASRLSGAFLYYNNSAEGGQREEEGAKGTIPLPCFGNAKQIDLNLRFLGLALPFSGAFTLLEELTLERIRFQGTCEVGDIVSSPRCPCLVRLRIRNVYGVATLTVLSKSLLEMELVELNGLQRLKIDAPFLQELVLLDCFRRNHPVANISAPQLIKVQWMDAYDSRYVQLGSLGHLRALWTRRILVYGPDHPGYNLDVLSLLQHFQFIHVLNITLLYPSVIVSNWHYLMEYVKYIPNVTYLNICVMNGGHAFGASSFHVLKLCTGVRSLALVPYDSQDEEIEKLSLNCLQEIEIMDLKGAEHEVTFLKRLFNCAGVLEKMRITFNYLVSKSKAKDLCQRLSSISRPETLMEFYMYRDQGRSSVELLSLEDEGTWV